MMRAQKLLSAAQWTGELLLHILFPRTCFACGADLPFRYTSPLCPSCRNAVRVPGPLICQRCGTVLPSGGAHCARCRGSKGKKFKCKVIRSAWLFGPQSRALIHAFKYSGYAFLADYLGTQMALRFKELPELAAAQVVIPVPLYPKRQKWRGYNQSELLAKAFARKVHLPVESRWLVRVRDTAAQAKLHRQERLDNMAGAFAATADVRGKTVLLIDDVATTGATLEGCAQALKEGGAKRVIAYTLAREP